MICEKCTHYEVCAQVMKNQLIIREKMMGEINPKCEHFINTSRFIELPFALGDEAYYIEDNKIIKSKIKEIDIEEKTAWIVFEPQPNRIGVDGVGIEVDSVYKTKEAAELAQNKERENNA